MIKNKVEGYAIVKNLDTNMYKIIKTETFIKNGGIHKTITELAEDKYIDVLRGFLNLNEYDNYVDYPNHRTISSVNVWECEF